MNVHKRFIAQFFIQLSLIFVILIIILISMFAIIGYSIIDEEVKQDLSKAESSYFTEKVNIKDDQVKFDDELKKLVKKQSGWLLVLTSTGEVIGDFNAPESTPIHFNGSELAALMIHDPSSPVKYKFWELNENTAKPTLLLYASNNSDMILLNEVKSGINWKSKQLNLSDRALRHFDVENGWVQLLNSAGEEMDGYNTDKQTSIKYSTIELLALIEDGNGSVVVNFDKETQQSIIVGIPTSNSISTQEGRLFKPLSNGIFAMYVLLFSLLIMGTIWYARKFGIPLITMMKWIQNLGSGLYEQPLDIHRRPIMMNKKGHLKRKYRLYKDIIITLSQLTETLRQNDKQRSKMTQNREEWISGLSHDLKTPLASISGYAQMIESENYLWTKTETKEFAGTIVEKSAYMMELLEDLTLTYRLKNHALPIAKELVDMNELLRRTIIHFINDPANNDKEFVFHAYNEAPLASIDPKWFKRIIDNLIANAIKYNPSGTLITVSISPIEEQLMIITIEDDGKGMDNETLDKLFQRYYRGTNTSESGSGTGLGMAISKQLVHLHGGSINVKSIPNNGTTVRIILPIKKEEDQEYLSSF